MALSSTENHSRIPLILGLIILVIACALPVQAQSGVMQCIALPTALRTPSIERKTAQVSQILIELGAERRRFIDKGSYVDLFASLYYPVTLAELDNAIRMDPAMAEILLDTTIAFYDSYRLNRMRFEKGGPSGVERHWRNYYKAASALSKKAKPSMSEVSFLLLDAIDAHLNDLARTLRYIFQRLTVPFEEFKKAYFEMDTLFESVPESVDKDIEAALPSVSQIAALDRTFHFGVTYVTHARHRAWEAAVGKGKLVARGDQPILAHSEHNDCGLEGVPVLP